MKIGIDIIDIERMAIGQDKLARIFTESEMEFFKNKNWEIESIAGLFCAKEAFFKAIGTGVILSRLHDIEIRHNQQGAPFFKLSPRLISEHHLSTARMHLSISHAKTVAIAVCIIMQFDSFV